MRKGKTSFWIVVNSKGQGVLRKGAPVLYGTRREAEKNCSPLMTSFRVFIVPYKRPPK